MHLYLFWTLSWIQLITQILDVLSRHRLASLAVDFQGFENELRCYWIGTYGPSLSLLTPKITKNVCRLCSAAAQSRRFGSRGVARVVKIKMLTAQETSGQGKSRQVYLGLQFSRFRYFRNATKTKSCKIASSTKWRASRAIFARHFVASSLILVARRK